MEEKADTMYYISMVDTAVLGVLGGICIVVGVVGAFFTAGATLPIAGVGCVLGGAVISSHSYTKTLDSDRSAGRDRSWSQFYLERTVKEFQGAAAGAVVFAGLLAGADLIAAAGRISSSIPSIVTAGTSGGTMAGALEAAGLEEAILGFGSMAVLLEAAMNAGKGGESKEGVGIEKKEVSVEELVKKIPKKYKKWGKCKEFK